MYTEITNRTNVTFQYLRTMAEALYKTHSRVVPLVGFIRDNTLVSVTTVMSGKIQDAIVAGVIGRAGYNADGIAFLHEGLSATTEINPLTGNEWRDNEIEDVLRMDGGLNVAMRNLTMACAGSGVPMELIFQEFEATRHGFIWGDEFTHTEASGLEISGEIPDAVREILNGARIDLLDASLVRQLVEATITSRSRDESTTRILVSKGLPTQWNADAPQLRLPDNG